MRYDSKSKAYHLGYKDGDSCNLSKSQSNNPYKEGSIEFESYEYGYNHAVEDRLS